MPYFAMTLLFSALFIISCSDDYPTEDYPSNELCLMEHEVDSREIPCCVDAQVFLQAAPPTQSSASGDGDCCTYRLSVLVPEGCTTNLFDMGGNIIATFSSQSSVATFTFCGGIRRSATAFVLGETFEDPCFTLEASLDPFTTNQLGPVYTCRLSVQEVQFSEDPEDCCPVTVDVNTPFSTGGDCCLIEVTISNPPCTTCVYKLAINRNDGNKIDYQYFDDMEEGESTLSFEYCDSDDFSYYITTDIGKVICNEFTDQLNCN